MKIKFTKDFANNWKVGDIAEVKDMGHGDVLLDGVVIIDTNLLLKHCVVISEERTGNATLNYNDVYELIATQKAIIEKQDKIILNNDIIIENQKKIISNDELIISRLKVIVESQQEKIKLLERKLK